MSESFIAADWPAPAGVHAGTTTRLGGVSEGPLAGFNLGINVDEDPVRLERNRQLLADRLSLPAAPNWLRQVHGVDVVRAPQPTPTEADGSWTDQAGVVCAVLTADCLPVLLCDRDGRRVAALHAGWRGLAAGVVEQGVAALQVAPDRLLAWFGPAIGPNAFEVGDEVHEVFLARDAGCGHAFRQNRPGHWLADLYELARRRLQALGVRRIYGGGLCTAEDEQRFYSYRRDGRTGRMASLIWMA